MNIYVYDIEVMINYFAVIFKDVNTQQLIEYIIYKNYNTSEIIISCLSIILNSIKISNN